MERFNLTSWFVDRHLEEGRGDRTALLCGERRGDLRRARRARQPRRPRAARARRPPGGARAARALRRRRVRRHLVRRAEDRRGHRRGLHLPAGQGLRVLPGLHAGRRGRGRRDDARPRARGARGAGRPAVAARAAGRRASRRTNCSEGEASFDALVADAPAALDPAPTTADDIAIWKFTTGSTGMPKACVHRMQTPLRSFEHYARGVLDIREDDVVLPVPKLFFGYARDLAALYPFGVGAAGIVFAERSTPERMFELIARHRPTILVNVPTMIRAMLEQPDHDLSCLRLCTSAGEALPEELHRRWTESFGVEVLDGIGSSEAYHIYISNRPGAARPGRSARPCRATARGWSTRTGSELPDGETGRLWIEGDTAALMYWEAREKSVRDLRGRRGHERRPLRARRRRLLPLPRPRRRPAQGRRHLGGPAGDRAVPHRARRRGRVRRRRLRGGRACRSRGRSSSLRDGRRPMPRRCRRT